MRGENSRVLEGNMVGSALVEAMAGDLGRKVQILSEDFDPRAVVVEPVPPVVENGKEMNGEVEREEEEEEKRGEIVLGRNVHASSLAVTEPDANDEFTGDKEAYMASVLARYRKTLMERTKHHLGNVLIIIPFADLVVCSHFIYLLKHG